MRAGRSLLVGTALVLALGPFAPRSSLAAGSGVTYHFPAPPIASAGSLGPGASISFDLRVENNGAPDPGGSVYLGYFNGSHVSGDLTSVPASQCNGVSSLPSTGSAIPCTADSQGIVVLTYHVPAQLPAQGHTGWVAESSPGSPSNAVEHYVYSTVFRFNPSPIAPSGHLAAGATVPVTLSAEDGLNQPVPNDTVYLSFVAAHGGGSARVGTKALTATPAPFVTAGDGTVPIVYTAPASPPATGQDAIRVQDLPHSAKETNSDSYAFAAATPTVSVGDVTVFEGDQDPGIPAQFTVTVSPPQPQAMTVQYVTLCGIGDKTCAEDFVEVPSPATITIPANASSTTILVRQFAYIGGNAGETYREGWYVELLNPSTGVVGRSVGSGLLLPDVENTQTALAYLYTGSVASRPQTTSAVPVYFTVTLGAVEKTPVVFDYATADGTAVAGRDYTATSGVATIAAGKTSAVIPVQLSPASPPTSTLTFSLTISAAVSATISSATGIGYVLAG